MHWDTGNIAFMLVSTSLVMLMTPGLAFFYGGLVGRKNVLTIMLQSFVSMGVTTVLWVVCGYSMAFSGSYQSATNPDIAGHHRQLRPGVLSRRRSVHAVPRIADDSADRVRRVSNDVRADHAGAHHRARSPIA